MPASPPPLFGRLFHVFLSRADIDRSELAGYLDLDPATIRDLEIRGLGKTPLIIELFYERLKNVPGFSDEAINVLEKAREIDELTEELVGHLGSFAREMGSFELSDQQNLLLGEPLNKLDQEIAFELKVVKEEAQEPSSESFTGTSEDGIISPHMKPTEAEGGERLPRTISDPQRQDDPGAVQGTNAPEHVLEQPSNKPEQRRGAPKKADIYQRRTRYDNAYLEEHAEQLSQRFLEALRNPEDSLNHAAKQGLHVFAETMAQTEGKSLSQAAREHNIPHGSLAGWVRRRLVPTLYKDSHTTYIANDTAKSVVDLNQKAREEGKPLARLLKEMRDKIFPFAALGEEQGQQALKPTEGSNEEQQTDRLITLKEAAGLYPDEVSYGDVLRWHYSGLLEEQGRRWLARPGGRSIPLVSEVEVAYLKDNRPPRGPTESFKKKMRKHIDSLKK
jgi:hypothetical protein